MAAKDSIHEQVKRALEKDDWHINYDPLYVKVRGSGVKIDLGAEKFLLAQKEDNRIAVKIKTFSHYSIMHAFTEALGKYKIYLKAIAKSLKNKDRKLYIAVSMQGYYRLMDVEFIKEVIDEENIALIVVDIDKEIIVKWIE